MHPRSKHLVLFIFFLLLLVLLIGLLVTKVEAPEYSEAQNASAFSADTEVSFRVEHADGHTHARERDAFITKVRSTLSEGELDTAYEDAPEVAIDPEPAYDAELPQESENSLGGTILPNASNETQETITDTTTQPEVTPAPPLQTRDVAPAILPTETATETLYGNTDF